MPSLFDVRWLRLRHTRDYVTAGLVFALRPERELGDGPEEDCPGGQPEPSLRGDVTHEQVDADTVRFKARPLGTELVGFGLDYVGPKGDSIDVSQEGVSLQLGITPKVRRPNGIVRVDLSLSGNRAVVAAATAVTVAVVPCLAPIVPSHEAGQLLSVNLASGRVKTLDWDLNGADRQVQAACRLDPTKSNDDFSEAALR